MRNTAIAFVVLLLAAAGLAAAFLLSDRDPTHHQATPESATAEPLPAEPPSSGNNAGQLPYTPPNPEPDMDPEQLAAESRSLLRAIPVDMRQSLIVEEPQVDSEQSAYLEGMVWIPGGVFVMGNNYGPPDEAPRHAVALDGFWMDATEVTNEQFAEFVDATGYVTLAEKKPELRSIRDDAGLEGLAILDEMNQPGSICSLQLSSRDEIDERGAYSWWQYVAGASWKHPEGPDSDLDGRMNHPVVHLSWLDVQEYCSWAEKQLPSEAQWEYAARGGHDGRVYPWGNTRQPEGNWLQNIWQGEFPVNNTGEDGYTGTAPVGTFPPNDFGLYDMSGNVWEWCRDYYRPDSYEHSPVRNPPGPQESLDPQEPHIIKRVQRGGSFMCSDQYCIGYRVAARMKGEEDTGAFHTGFRCIVTPGMLQERAE